MVEFLVSSTNPVPDKRQVVIHGALAGGSVRPGMKVLVARPASAPVPAEIAGMSMAMKDGRFEVGLILACDSDDGMKALEVRVGELVRLEERGATSASARPEPAP